MTDHKTTKQIRDVAAMMAVEDMPLSPSFVEELVKVVKGEKHQNN